MVGISRKTIIRWRERVPGFGDAYDKAAALGRDGSAKARQELSLIVAAWTPGGITEVDPRPELAPEPSKAPATEPAPDPEPAEAPVLEAAQRPGIDNLEREPAWVRERVRSALELATDRAEAEVVEPDVLDAAGSEVSVRGPRAPLAPYTKVRPPTRDEWLAEMAAIAKDPEQPERVRVTAIAAVSSGLFGGPGGRSTRPADLDDATVAAAAKRGRDPGVPASVWEQARRNFLGPAPEQDEASSPLQFPTGAAEPEDPAEAISAGAGR